jgi:hypothetical protein
MILQKVTNWLIAQNDSRHVAKTTLEEDYIIMLGMVLKPV